MIVIALVLILLIPIIIGLTVFIIKNDAKKTLKKIDSLQEALDNKGFYSSEVISVSKFLSIALNKYHTKFAIIKGFNPKRPEEIKFQEVAVSFITKIEKSRFSAKIYYSSKGEIKTLFISPASSAVKDFVHQIYKDACVKKIENKFPDNRFELTSACDWQCNFVWAYDTKKNAFAYYKSTPKFDLYKINLRKEFFSIDLKYKYFEAPVLGVQQSLSVFEESFLDDLYSSLFESIKEKSACAFEDKIYFDSYNNIIYLSNGEGLLKSIILKKIDDVDYRDNKLIFSLVNSEKIINFNADKEFIEEFSEFVTNYNLKSIAQNFNYKTDKLINTTQNTKFVVDTTRDRIIYCANLDKFARFSYMTISFSNLEDVSIEKAMIKSFVRIHTKDNEIIDVTCDKQEIAAYIEAQLKSIINS